MLYQLCYKEFINEIERLETCFWSWFGLKRVSGHPSGAANVGSCLELFP